jgi:alpha-1,2-mannosyltransferase
MRLRPLALPALAALLCGTVYIVRIQGDMADFGVNYRAGERIVRGETLYQTGDGHFMFKYFPFSAMLYVPLSVLPVEAAKAIWYALSVVGAVALFFVAKHIVSGDDKREWWVLAIPPVVLAKFFFRELKLGQINILVTLVLLFMVVSLLGAHRARAGALWGLATALKPYGFIFFPYFIVTGNWRALASGLGVLAVAFVLPSVFYGFEGNLEVHREWYVTLSESTPGQLAGADNISIIGALTKWSGNAVLSGKLAVVVLLVLAAAILAIVVRGRGMPRAAILECALLLTLIPLVSPMGWDYQLLTAVLAVTLLADLFVALPLRWLLALDFAVIALSIYDLVGRTAYQAFMNASILTVCFAMVVAYLAYLRAAKLA